MGIELPAELVSVAAAAGVVWPEADEDRMRQAAGAWREAGVRMGSLAGDADGTARTALSSFAGEAGDAANRHWERFVTPDTGHLTATITSCTANADKLEHAAQQVGEAKVAIVRNLVELAKNTDAAHSAAAAGLPNALLGLETALRGTAANVAHIKDTLVGSVLPGTGAAGFTNVVDPNPGAPGGPIGASLPAPVQNLVGGGSAGQAGQGLAGVVPGVVSGLTGNGGPTGLPVVDTMVRGVQHAVANQALPVLGDSGPGAPAGAGATGGTGLPLVDNLVSGVDHALTGTPAGGPVGGALDGAGRVVDTAAGVVDTASGTVDNVVGAQPGSGPPGPVAQVVDNTAGAVDRGTDQAGSQAGHQPPPGRGSSGPVPSGAGPLAPVVSGAVDLPGHVAAELPVNHDAVRAASAAVLDAPAHAAAPVAGSVPPAQQNLGGAFAGGGAGAGGGGVGGGALAGGGAVVGGAVGGGGPVSPAPVSGGPGASAAVVGRPAVPVAGAVPAAGAALGGPGASGGSGGPGGGSGAAGGAATGRAEPGGARTEPGARAAAGAVAAAGGASGSGGGRLAGADPAVTATDHGKPGTAKPDKATATPVSHQPDEVGGVVPVGIQGALAGQTPPETPTDARQTKLVDLLGGRPAGSAPTGGPTGNPTSSPTGDPAGGSTNSPSGGSAGGPGGGQDGRAAGAQQPAAGAAGGLAAAPAPRAGRADQDPALALFLVGLFPLGHLPVAGAAPARQLAAPPVELDYAAGGRFAPDDHPRSDLIDLTTRISSPAPTAPTVPAGHLADGYDPLGGEHERDWDRRFLVRPYDPNDPASATEYAWPPGEVFPEGGVAAGEPDVLAVGTVVDRFGTAEGRVFAAGGTPFARRSLPPALLTAGYHRYRVLRPLPVWRAVSAAWFAQPGGGDRLRATRSAADLVALGYLVDITEEVRA
ncbi:TNT domain-containing protein [Actinokineospora spheciospongiae]|uniref:TNT domain-containing protein n=1 Tax=Actinokineospora spheciospongiae TaxID=909613 RepID=UPI000D81DAB1|nr:TNT domain-containing protein [Actinokineospora spheciospongiae]PWW64534.1 uncharacterized protein DUF4237 [Actinokineospora spheciospongiae]